MTGQTGLFVLIDWLLSRFMSSHSLCEKMFTRDWKIFIEWKWMKFHKKHNNPPALFKYLSQGEDGGEVTAWTLCSNVITSQLWLTLNLGHPTLPSRGARGGQGRTGLYRWEGASPCSRCRDCGHSLLDIMTRSADIRHTEDRQSDGLGSVGCGDSNWWRLPQ